MEKQILIYSPIYSYTVIDIMTQMEEAKDADIVLRVNSPGGEVYYAYGVIAKYLEHVNGKVIKADGIAASATAFMCCASDRVECLDVTTFLFHRAAYPLWIEGDPELFTEDKKADLKKMNDQLRALMEGKFTAQKWEEVTGISLDRLFSLTERIDVTLNAKQAKKLGLVAQINPITQAKKAEIEALSLSAAAYKLPDVPEPIAQPINADIIKQHKSMTIEKLKADHPEVYKAAYNEGVAAEKDRVEAHMAFADVDLKAVKEGIEKGAVLSGKAMAEFSRKAMAQAALGKMKEENAETVTTTEVAKEDEGVKAPEAAKTAEFTKSLRADLGLK